MAKKSQSLIVFTLLLLCHGSSSRSRNWDLTGAFLKFIREGTKHYQQEPPDTEILLPEYDFIIVGAGSAGCALANRLSEVSDWKILLIEAGRQENYAMDIPFVTTLLQFTEANWQYKTQQCSNSCLGMKHKQCSIPRGKVVGGCSVINFMVYSRGTRNDYDSWEKLGNPGWGYKDVLPYFLQIEDMTIPGLYNDTVYHSRGGEMTISYAPYRTHLAEAFVEAGKEMGYNRVDYNGEPGIGFDFLQTTMRNGTRLSASRAFLHPIRNRKNLSLKKRSMVTKILIDQETKRAYGVEFVQNRNKYTVRAKKEVILSAGTINSPQLMMLSGVGPKDHLESLGIPVIKDLKVGYNLMDHVGLVGMTFIVNNSVGLILDDLLEDGSNIVDYLSYHKGPFSVPAACEALAFIDTKTSDGAVENPDLEIAFFGANIPSERSVYRSLGISDYVYETVYKPIENVHTWTAVPVTLKPKSRGRIMLNSKNPFQKPNIYHDFFENPDDLEIQLLGVKKILELSKTEAFQKYGSRVHDIPIPGCEHFTFNSDEYWRCVIKHLATGAFHLTTSCKMGPANDEDAVVDPRLKVYGIKGLRVIDASVMPIVPAGHTNIPCMMLGVKGADIVKEDWGI